MRGPRGLLSAVLLSLLALSLPVSAQYFTATISSTLPFNTGSTPPVVNTVEPTCVQDYRAVWNQNPVAAMWSLSGGVNYVTDTPQQAFYSTNGFSTVTPTTPGTFIGRAGAAAVMIGGTGLPYPAGAVYMWGGLYADDIGLFGAEYSLDNLNSTFAAASPPQALFRIAYAVMPWMNYIVQAGGVDSASLTTNYLGGSTAEVWYSTNQGVTWTQAPGPMPFPGFISGNMVALFDGASVPSSGSTQPYSTLVLIVPQQGATYVYTSITGGLTWSSGTVAPWLVSADTGLRVGGSAAVDFSNNVYYMGGSTATADLYFSSNKGSTWNLIPISTGSGQQAYAASYSSCLGVRYTTTSAPPTLVLYSGQIYSSTTTSSAALAMPSPSVYAMTFTLSATSTAPSTTPLAPQYPGTAPSSYYFSIQYSQSALQLSLGLPYTVCYNGVLTTAAHAGFGDSEPSLPYQLVVGASGVRVFTNTTYSVSQTILGVTYPDYDTYFPNNHIFPTSQSIVDFYGLAFQLNGPAVFTSPPPPNAFPYPWNSGTQTVYNYTQIVDFSFNTLTQWQENPNPDSAAVGVMFNLTAVSSGSNPYPACSTALLPAVSPVVSSIPAPFITGMTGCSQGNVSLQVGSGQNLCTQADSALAVDILGVNFIAPLYVYIQDASGNTGLCTINEGNTALPTVISCFPVFAVPNAPSPVNSWVTVQVQTVSGKSNALPGLLFSTQSAAPWPPAIYNVTGTGCSPLSASMTVVYGPGSRNCSRSTAFTVVGDFFTSSSVVSVGSSPCSPTTFISSQLLGCTTSQPASTVPYVVQVINSGSSISTVSNQFVGLVLSGAGSPTGAATALRLAGTAGGLVVAAVTAFAVLAVALVL